MKISRPYTIACKHFGHQKGDGMVLHHIDKTLKETNPERYNEWRIEDLVLVTKAEHNKIHGPDFNHPSYKGENNHMYGVHRYGEEAPTYGKVWTDEERKHASEGQRRRYEQNPESFKKPEGCLAGENNPMYGKKHSQTARLKQSLRAKLRGGSITQEEFEILWKEVLDGNTA